MSVAVRYYGGVGPVELEILVADQWRTLRDIRLRALKDSPAAYISEYEVEAARGEENWRDDFALSQWVVARRGERIIGLVRSLQVEGRPADERHLESVWVDPRDRRTGVLRTILRHLTEVEPEVRDWRVWVLDTNAVARNVYDRLGFSPTGESQPLTDGSGRSEIRLGARSERVGRSE